MRTAFIRALTEQARLRDDVFLIVGDLGYSVVEAFAREFPDRFLNAGVAEQNMAGLAAGLASEGRHVFTYSIANFPTLRCLEQIRNDICHHQLPVTVVAVGGGLAYGNLGYSHHGLEDLGIMRTLPHMTVCAPGDPVETGLVVRELCARPGPSYLRLGKAGEPVVHRAPPPYVLGRAIRVAEGRDVSLFSTGSMLAVGAAVRELLAARGVSIELVSLPTLVPLDREAILASVRKTGFAVTVEEHGEGGLGSVMAEVMAGEAGGSPRLMICRTPREPAGAPGDQDYLRECYGLSPGKIAARILGAL